MMKSSYNNKEIVTYKDIFELIFKFYDNKMQFNIVEFGILNGFSLKIIADYFSFSNIQAFDIFDKFDGNHACKDHLIKLFNDYGNVSIHFGDFYQQHNVINDNSIDILHIDIANNGDIYEFTEQMYFRKMRSGGIILLEGGSLERDNVEWMIKYNKKK